MTGFRFQLTDPPIVGGRRYGIEYAFNQWVKSSRQAPPGVPRLPTPFGPGSQIPEGLLKQSSLAEYLD